MEKEKGFKSIEELVKSLAGKVGELSIGSVDVKDIEHMCEESRELYERLVVLRHRGREALLEGKEAIELDASNGQVENEADNSPIQKELPVMTLDFGSVDEEEGNTTEIVGSEDTETIESSKAKQPTPAVEPELEAIPEVQATEIPPSPKEQVSLQDPSVATSGKMPLPELSAAIGLNQKFMFISQIFNGKKDEYARAIEELSSVSEKENALEKAKQLTSHLSDEEDEGEAKKQFLDLIERRFE